MLTAEVQSHLYRIYDSINDVSPADWQRLTGNVPDLGMDPRMIRVLEETLADQLPGQLMDYAAGRRAPVTTRWRNR